MHVSVTYHIRPEDQPFIANLSDQIPDLHSLKMDSAPLGASCSILSTRAGLMKLSQVITDYLCSEHEDHKWNPNPPVEAPDMHPSDMLEVQS